MQNHFSLNASRTLAALLLLLHALSVLVILLIPLPLWARWAVMCALLGSLVYYLRRDAWRSLPTSCVALRLEKARIVLIARNGQEIAGQVLSNSVVMPFMTLVRVLPQGAQFARSVVIFPDAIAHEQFRALRVALRWGG